MSEPLKHCNFICNRIDDAGIRANLCRGAYSQTHAHQIVRDVRRLEQWFGCRDVHRAAIPPMPPGAPIADGRRSGHMIDGAPARQLSGPAAAGRHVCWLLSQSWSCSIYDQRDDFHVLTSRPFPLRCPALRTPASSSRQRPKARSRPGWHWTDIAENCATWPSHLFARRQSTSSASKTAYVGIGW